ncbi:RecX family transcriptional regulator [Alphaproteobacteria bacterium]|nr:RecX family transcriptional regulator [Alphaproteobacteria bacterium]
MELDEFLYNKSISYLGRYPATKKKLTTHLEKKIKSKRYSHKYKVSNEDLDYAIKQVIERLVNLRVLNEKNYLESLFNYYCRSMFSINKMKNKFYVQGFEKNDTDEFISNAIFENPDLEFDILVSYVKKKKLKTEEQLIFRKKLFQAGFNNETIIRFLKT